MRRERLVHNFGFDTARMAVQSRQARRLAKVLNYTPEATPGPLLAGEVLLESGRWGCGGS